MGFYVEVWGSAACFTRPEMKVERVSYDVITPSAARNLLQSIYWHPGMNWVVDAIQVCNPIQFSMMKKNEVSHGIDLDVFIKNANAGFFESIDTNKLRSQRRMVYLKNVKYVISAHFELTDESNHSAADFAKIIGRRMEHGGFYRQPCMGLREFPAYYRQVDGFKSVCDETLKGDKDLGWMLLDMDYRDMKNIEPRFFRPVMHDGIFEVPKYDLV